VAVQPARSADSAALARQPGGDGSVVVTRRPAGPGDEPYLRQLFVESRDDLARLPAEVRDSLLDLQYRGQRRQIEADYPAAAREVLVADGADAGLLIRDRDPERIHLVDIVVARSRRRRGIASVALRSVIDEAGERSVTLTVWSGNAIALALYGRFGFAEINGSNVTEGYIFMERRAGR
jgi:ribosomal protein S18 acetylase RimI-like enzyme